MACDNLLFLEQINVLHAYCHSARGNITAILRPATLLDEAEKELQCLYAASVHSYNSHLTLPQAYHSIFLGDQGVQLLGNFPLLPLRTRTRGPAYALPALPAGSNPLDVDPDSESYDILDESLSLFRANVFFRNFEIQGPADRHLIYCILFLSDCLAKLKPSLDAKAAEKFLINLSLEQFSLPGEPGFPLNQAFEGPRDRQDAETLRGYLSQVRQELALRLHSRLFEGGSSTPNKFWMSFAKRKFMQKSL